VAAAAASIILEQVVQGIDDGQPALGVVSVLPAGLDRQITSADRAAVVILLQQAPPFVPVEGVGAEGTGDFTITRPGGQTLHELFPYFPAHLRPLARAVPVFFRGSRSGIEGPQAVGTVDIPAGKLIDNDFQPGGYFVSAGSAFHDSSPVVESLDGISGPFREMDLAVLRLATRSHAISGLGAPVLLKDHMAIGMPVVKR